MRDIFYCIVLYGGGGLVCAIFFTVKYFMKGGLRVRHGFYLNVLHVTRTVFACEP